MSTIFGFGKIYPKMAELMDLLANNNDVAFTHSGSMHADDALCGSLLDAMIYIVNSKLNTTAGLRIDRVNDQYLKEHELNDENALIFDIGGGKFDHHQNDCPCRDPSNNLSKYAALGRLWAEIGREVCLLDGAKNEEAAKIAAEYLDKTFIQNMDRTDNFGQENYPNPLAFYVKALARPDYHVSIDRAYEYFKSHFDFQSLIECAIAHGNDQIQAKELAEKTKEDFIVLDKFIPAGNFVETHLKFTITASIRDKDCWNLNAVDSKKWPVPTGCEGENFCHVQRFLAVFDSKEHAIAAAKFAIQKSKDKD